MLLMPLSPGRVQEGNQCQALPFHLSLKAVAADLLPTTVCLQILHEEVIAPISCPFQCQFLAVHFAAVDERSIAEGAPSRDDWRFSQSVLDNVVKSQDARLVRFGNPIFAHANYAILAL